MYHPRSITADPRLAYTDYTPNGPWIDSQQVTRNIDGVLFTYSATLNALLVNSNQSGIIKDANNFPIINLPDPVNNLDAANKEYVDSHGGGGGGIPDAPNDGQQYGRQSLAWSVVVPNPAASSTTPLMDGTAAVGTGTTWARADHIHPTDTTRAPLASPTFTGTPAAPTPATADNSTTIPTTAFVKAQGYLTGNQTVTLTGDITGSGATSIATTLATVNSNVGTYQGITVNGKGLVTAAVNMSYAPLASPTFTGTPAAPTAVTADNSTTLATTAYVKNQGYLSGNQTITLSGDISGSGTTAITTTLPTVNSNVGTFQGITVNGKGQVTAAVNQNYAPLASPTFTGIPAAPTAAVSTNTTQLATTAFVVGQAGTANPAMDGTVAVGTSLLYARQDHVHPSDTSRAPNTVFVASGASHAQGLVPDPGSTAGTTRFLREDATWQVPAGGSGTAAATLCGQLQYVSATQIKLIPFMGADLRISGTVQQIPAAGVTASNSGLSASTLYYVYAYMSSGTMTLEIVTTTHATDSTAGNQGTEIKSGDNTRSLIGILYTNSSSQFAYSVTQRNVRSWFNRQSMPLRIALAASTSLNATSAEIGSGSLRTEIVNWTNEVLSMHGAFAYFNNTNGAIITVQFSLDGTVVSGVTGVINGPGTGAVLPCGQVEYCDSPTEGHHILSVFGSCNSGTGSLYINTYYTAKVTQ